jgi:proliferating cell nuclear antigen PCNA
MGIKSVPNNPNYVFEAKTVKSGPLKLTFEVLKDILTDANLVFDGEGVKMLEMDTTHIVLANLTLKTDEFEYYYCAPGKRYVCGINLNNFHKIMKTIGNDDIISFYLDIDEPNELGMSIENSTTHSVKNIKFKLLDLDETPYNIPPANFTKVITIPTNMLQKIFRDFSPLTENIEIKSINNQLIFSCDCAIGHIEEIISENNNSLSVKDTSETEIIQGVFKLKHLVTFTKGTNLCQHVELLLKNDYPLILNYKVASLGELILCLAPKLNNT